VHDWSLAAHLLLDHWAELGLNGEAATASSSPGSRRCRRGRAELTALMASAKIGTVLITDELLGAGSAGQASTLRLPQQHQDEDQPHVVGFPERGNGLVDEPSGAAARSAPPASRSQIPPPKSAPPNSAYAASTANMIAATPIASGDGFMERPARQRMPWEQPVPGRMAPARRPLRRAIPAATALT